MMAIIGFVLVAVAAVFGIEIVAMNNVSVDIDAFNQVYETSVALVFVAGVVAGLAAALGLMLVRDGLARSRRLRIEAKDVQERRERHIAALEEERAAMHRSDVRANDGDNVDLRDGDRVTTF
jgi:hypothetical protein